jgi:spore coat protein U-like protein
LLQLFTLIKPKELFMKHQSFLKPLLIATAIACSTNAFAESKTANFDVKVQVLSTCSISASNMTFSSITTGTTSNTDATSSLTVNCSQGTPYTVSLDGGKNYSAGRRLASGASYINYYFYSDAGRSSEWDSAAPQSGTGSGSDQNVTVYGRIPSGQSIGYTGSYADTVIATITY